MYVPAHTPACLCARMRAVCSQGVERFIVYPHTAVLARGCQSRAYQFLSLSAAMAPPSTRTGRDSSVAHRRGCVYTSKGNLLLLRCFAVAMVAIALLTVAIMSASLAYKPDAAPYLWSVQTQSLGADHGEDQGSQEQGGSPMPTAVVNYRSWGDSHSQSSAHKQPPPLGMPRRSGQLAVRTLVNSAITAALQAHIRFQLWASLHLRCGLAAMQALFAMLCAIALKRTCKKHTGSLAAMLAALACFCGIAHYSQQAAIHRWATLIEQTSPTDTGYAPQPDAIALAFMELHSPLTPSKWVVSPEVSVFLEDADYQEYRQRLRRLVPQHSYRSSSDSAYLFPLHIQDAALQAMRPRCIEPVHMTGMPSHPSPALVVVANRGNGDCWFECHSQHTGHAVRWSRRFVASWACAHQHAAGAEWGRLCRCGELATEQHVNATVQAFAPCYPNGLVVVHEPAGMGLVYWPGEAPKVLPLRHAIALLADQVHPARGVLYTEPEGPHQPGHFETLVWNPSACQPSRLNISEGIADSGASSPLMLGGMDAASNMGDAIEVPDSPRSNTSDELYLQAVHGAETVGGAVLAAPGIPADTPAELYLQAVRGAESVGGAELSAPCIPADTSDALYLQAVRGAESVGGAELAAPCIPADTLAVLLQMGVSRPMASAAVAQFPQDVEGAVLWATDQSSQQPRQERSRSPRSRTHADQASMVRTATGVARGGHASSSSAASCSMNHSRSASVQPTSHQQRWRPPRCGPAAATQSWLFVPALLQASGHLAPCIAVEWDSHPLAGVAWQRLTNTLQRAPNSRLDSLVGTLRTLVDEAGAAAHEGDVALLAQWRSCSPSSNCMAGVPLRAAVQQAMLADGYIPPLAQEALLLAYGTPDMVRDIHHVERCFQDTSPGRQPASGSEFSTAPDTEVQWWVDRLMSVSPDCVTQALSQVPMYSQYITRSSVADVARDALAGLQAYTDTPMCAEVACEVAPRLGATMPLRLAVAITYAGHTTAKPLYFLTDLAYTTIANLLHAECHICPYHEDPEMKVYPRFNALPTGDTTCGKSPAFNMIANSYINHLRLQTEMWPFAARTESNMHSDGSHGLFNEVMRATDGHVLFAGPEAVNYLSPEFPERGRCDKSSYVDMPRLLDLSTGGRYKWGTATEIKEQRAFTRRLAMMREAGRSAGAVAENSPAHVSPVSAQGPACARETTHDYRPICFAHTNVNVCWFQQLDLLQQWWVPSGRKRHLGFAGRFLLSFTLERSVPPGARRAGGGPLLEVLGNIWTNTLQHWGPRSRSVASLTLSSVGAAAWSEHMYQGVASLRARRREYRYAHRAMLGKWEYWAASVAALNHAIQGGMAGTGGTEIDDNALKCALRFVDQRLMFGANVLATEMGADPDTRRSQDATALPAGTTLSAENRTAAEVLRAVPEHVISHTILAKHVSAFRRRPGEQDQQLHGRRNRILEHLASRGFGLCARSSRSQNLALNKFPLTEATRALLRMWEFPVAMCQDFFPAHASVNVEAVTHLPLAEHATHTAAATAGAALPSNSPSMCGGAKRKREEQATVTVHGSSSSSTKVDVERQYVAQANASASAKWAASSGSSQPAPAVARKRHGRLAPSMLMRPAKQRCSARSSKQSARPTSHVPSGHGAIVIKKRAGPGQCRPGSDFMVNNSGTANSAASVRKRPAGPGRWKKGTGPRAHRAIMNSTIKFENWKQFKASQKEWASGLMPKQPITVHCEPRSVSSAGDFKYKLFCTACTSCRKQLTQYRGKKEAPPEKGWNAIVTYHAATEKLSREWAALDCHGDFAWATARDQLTAAGKEVVNKRLRAASGVTAQDLLDDLLDVQSPPPGEAWLSMYIKNFRQTHRLEAVVPCRPAGHVWSEADWHAQARKWSNFDAVCDQWRQQGWAELHAPNKLTIVGMLLGADYTCVVYCNPALARDVLQRLANPEYVKLCGDGTYKLIREGWALCSVGTLSKVYSPGEPDRMPAFRTSFHSFAYAIVNKESEATYAFLFKMVKHIAKMLVSADWHQCVRQYHCDWHIGEESARAREFPNSIRCGDWAHFTGAALRPTKQTPMSTDASACADQTAWRTGVWATLKRHVNAAPTLIFVKAWIQVLRTVPTCLLFTTLTTYLFETLHRKGELSCLAALRRHYFKKILASTARNLHSLQSWPGDPEFVWTADWWQGAERMQPGSTGGSQAQESWHRHKLKAFVKVIRHNIDDFAIRLERLTKNQLGQQQRSQQCFRDTPAEPFPDSYLLNGEPLLTRGRTSAFKFTNAAAYASYMADNGTLYYAMPHTLAARDDEGRWYEVPDDEITPPCAMLAERFASLLNAKTAEEITAAFVELGVAEPLHDGMKSLYKALRGTALVIIGKGVRQFWQHRTAATIDGQADAVALHSQALCVFCRDAATHGTCEHTHAALLAAKLLSRQVANKQARRGKKHTVLRSATAARYPILTSPHPPVAAASAASEHGDTSAHTEALDKHLAHALDACCLSQMKETFRAEGVTFADLLGATPAWLKAWFPMLRAGPAKRLLDYAAANSAVRSTENNGQGSCGQAERSSGRAASMIERE